MNATEFRKELVKIMPGYSWTVHRPSYKELNYLIATGIKTSGFNRISTLEVVKNKDSYTVRSSGFGKRAPWLSEFNDNTLARALRGLQEHYERRAQTYGQHAVDLESARRAKNPC